MRDAFGGLKDVPMQVNRMNFEAIRLLSEGRRPEADLLLQKALALDPQNIFTLNNLGVASESRGDYDEALTLLYGGRRFTFLRTSHRHAEPCVERKTGQRDGGGQREETERAHAKSSHRSRRRLRCSRCAGFQRPIAMIGQLAGKTSSSLTRLIRNSAFSLNNVGYLAEMDGDLETAQFFYAKARKGRGRQRPRWTCDPEFRRREASFCSGHR